jgi:ParB family chromosome partitioning protein
MILTENLSVRRVEELVKETKDAQKNGTSEVRKSIRKTNPISFTQQKYKDDLAELLKSKVKLKLGNNGSGNLVIPFKSEEDFERIMKIIDA